jgi:hypothetical protein
MFVVPVLRLNEALSLQNAGNSLTNVLLTIFEAGKSSETTFRWELCPTVFFLTQG